MNTGEKTFAAGDKHHVRRRASVHWSTTYECLRVQRRIKVKGCSGKNKSVWIGKDLVWGVTQIEQLSKKLIPVEEVCSSTSEDSSCEGVAQR